MKNFFNNEDGYMLVVAMVLMIILLTMGAVILNIGTSEFKAAEKNKNEVKAYYLARSGAELMADTIINNINNPDIDFESIKNVDHNLKDKEDNIIIKSIFVKPEGDNYIIQATAEVGNEEETVEIVLKEEEIADLFDRTIFTRNEINLNMATNVTGPAIETHGNITDDNDIFPDELEISNSNRPMPSLPEFPEYPTSGDLKSEYTINVDSYYNDIDITPNKVLTIDTTNGTLDTSDDKNINLVVDTIMIKGELEVKGEGKVFIYINEAGSFQTPHADSNQVYVFLADGASFELQAGGDFNGFIYGPNASVSMQSQGGGVEEGVNLNGAIIANKLTAKDEPAFKGTIIYKLPDNIGDYVSSIYTKGEWRRKQ